MNGTLIQIYEAFIAYIKGEQSDPHKELYLNKDEIEIGRKDIIWTLENRVKQLKGEL